MVSGLDPVSVLRRAGGTASASDMRSLFTTRELRRAVDDGRIVRAGGRHYALPGVEEALMAAARLNGVVSGLSAAQAWGWKVKLSPPEPQVTIPRRRRRSAKDREGIHVVWRDLPADAVTGRVTTRLETAVDCMRRLPFDEALAVADSSLRQGGLTKGQLIAGARNAPRTGRSKAVTVAEAADSRADNPFESCLRAVALRVPGLEVLPQFLVEDIGHADLADPRLRLAIEADSYEHHTLKEAFRYDVRRYTAMVRHRWRVVRFVWEDVMYRQDYVEAVLRDVVAQGVPAYGQFITPSRDSRLRPWA